MKQSEITNLESKAKAKRDATVASANQTYEETMRAIKLVAGLMTSDSSDRLFQSDEEPPRRDIKRVRLTDEAKDTTAGQIREAIKGYATGVQFTSIDIRKIMFGGSGELDRNLAGAFSSTLKRVAIDESMAKLITKAKGRMPAVYERIDEQDDHG